ncbi:hypothetical protein [Planomonospora algeriensis]
MAALKDTTTRILPAAGRMTPRDVFDYRCAQELADLMGTRIVEFPGGHNGNTTHPRAYASRLREVLRLRQAEVEPTDSFTSCSCGRTG